MLCSEGALEFILRKTHSVDIPDIGLFDETLRQAVTKVPAFPIGVSSQLGSGRFGRVFRITNTNGNRCAIKLGKAF